MIGPLTAPGTDVGVDGEVDDDVDDAVLEGFDEDVEDDAVDEDGDADEEDDAALDDAGVRTGAVVAADGMLRTIHAVATSAARAVKSPPRNVQLVDLVARDRRRPAACVPCLLLMAPPPRGRRSRTGAVGDDHLPKHATVVDVPRQ